jgi:hypothetical protein
MAKAAKVTNATNNGTIHLLSHLVILASCLLTVIQDCTQRVGSFPTN